MDIRTARLELQVAAYERGLIPCIPALKQAEKELEAGRSDAQPDPEPEKKAEPPAAAELSPHEPDDFSDIYRAFEAE